MNTAQSDLDEAEDTLPADYAAKVRRWCIELEEYRDRLRNSVEPDTRKQIADQTRLIGQQIASAEARPDARVAVLMRRLNSDLGFYDRQVRADSDPEANQRFDLLVSRATSNYDSVRFIGTSRARSVIGHGNATYSIRRRHWETKRQSQMTLRAYVPPFLRNGEICLPSRPSGM